MCTRGMFSTSAIKTPFGAPVGAGLVGAGDLDSDVLGLAPCAERNDVSHPKGIGERFHAATKKTLGLPTA